MLEIVDILSQKIRSYSLFSLVLFVGLVLLPFIHNPSAQIPYEIPRVYFFYGWSVLLLLTSFYQKAKAPSGSLVVWIMLYALIVVGVSMVGVDPLKSLQGNFYRRDGLLTLYFCVTFAWAIALGWRENWGNVLAKIVAINLSSG